MKVTRKEAQGFKKAFTSKGITEDDEYNLREFGITKERYEAMYYRLRDKFGLPLLWPRTLLGNAATFE